MGESVERGLDIRDVHKLWDASEEIRMRIRSGYGAIHEKSALSLDNHNATLNASLLRPLLLAMAGDATRKLPSVPDLRSELAALFESSKRTGPEVAKFVGTEPTHIRYGCSSFEYPDIRCLDTYDYPSPEGNRSSCSSQRGVDGHATWADLCLHPIVLQCLLELLFFDRNSMKSSAEEMEPNDVEKVEADDGVPDETPEPEKRPKEDAVDGGSPAPKAKAKAKGKANARASQMQSASELSSITLPEALWYFEVSTADELLEKMVAYARLFPSLPVCQSTKCKLQADLLDTEHCQLTVYWTRATVGVLLKNAKREIANFSPSSAYKDVPWSMKQALALKTGEILAVYVDFLIKDEYITADDVTESAEVSMMSHFLKEQMQSALDFILTVLLTIWSVDSTTLTQDYEFLEFFAGCGTMYRMMSALGRYKSARFDIKDASSRGQKSNFMDLNSSSGFAKYPAAFCAELVRISQDLKAHRKGCPQEPENIPSGPEQLSVLMTGEDDNFQFADLPDVYRYLRGGRKLRLPEMWRAVIPASL
ncbi:unnamed protein product [Symbiodinium sp. CCMP2592]|nr:unnamed protein product [Symbiodinium sp. CCMP2592]